MIININNYELELELNKVAKQANSGLLLRAGKNVFLATLAREDSQIEEDFCPLTVSYIEKTYAVGKIPGGFIKRETKPSELEILTSRLIDRTIRPLFLDGYRHPTHLVVMALSIEPGTDIAPLALYAASAALSLSDIPLKASPACVRVAKLQHGFIINPTLAELEKSSCDLFVSGAGDELLMIEMRSIGNEEGANEMSEDALLRALEIAKEEIKAISESFSQKLLPLKKQYEFCPHLVAQDEQIAKYLRENCLEQIRQAISTMAKTERASELEKIADYVLSQQPEFDPAALNNEISALKRELVRKMILEQNIRPDGRALDEVRPISIETNLLPMAHGSCLFTRGQTQALAVATLGSDADAQQIESCASGTISERFMLNYNFAGFCVGEASPLKAPSRRELGHGNLAKRAIAPSLPKDYAHTIRVVSEILESNGSSSMATVCASSLALAAANVPTSTLIAGVAMGLISDEAGKYAILSDICGLEDHEGDMDFKIAGSRAGISAMQMDIKLGGISTEILRAALMQAKAAREHILGIMERAHEQIELNYDVLPKLENFSVEPKDIPEIIGQGGKTIRDIIERFGVAIDLEREKGIVKISGQRASEAREYIQTNIVRQRQKPKDLFSPGDCINASVKKLSSFGAFIAIGYGIDGLLHASKFAPGSLAEGDAVRVKIIAIRGEKIELALAD